MANGPGGKSAGRVSIRVVPDSTLFTADLKKSLDRIEKSTVLNIPLEIDTHQAELELRRVMKRMQQEGNRDPIKVPAQVSDLDRTWQARLRNQVAAATKKIEATIPAGVDGERMRSELQAKVDEINRTLKVGIPTDPERAADFRSKLNGLVKEINDQSAAIDVDLKTVGALAHLRSFLRKRSLDIDVNITKSSVAKAATILASLSGARVAGDLVKDISNGLQNLDRSLPRIAAIMLAIGAIGAVALSSVGGLATLAVSLSGILGLAGPLPGIIGAAGTGALILAIALSTAKTELVSLTPVWANLKKIITDNFWAQAKKPIIDFVQSTLPQLRGALPGLSSALGAWAASITDGFKKAFGNEVLAGMLGNLRKSIDIAATGTGGFASAIAQLGTFGATYLPRLAQWFADLSNQFDAWLAKVTADGSLARWAETGITVSKQLFDVLGSTLSIITGIARAATAAGGGGLATFASVLGRIADVVNSEPFQSTLTTLFQGAAAGVVGLATALGPLGHMFEALAPTISVVLSSIGVTLGTVLGQIANTLARPEIANGILALFNGIRDGIQGLLPALPSLGLLLGTVATLAGTLAGQLGAVLGQAILTIVPLLVTLLNTIAPLIPQLGEALVTALIQLAPSFLQLIQAIVPLLPQLVTMATGLLPMLTQAIVVVTPLLVLLIGAVNGILNPFRMWIDLGGNVIRTLTGAQSVAQTMAAVLRGDFGPVFQWLGNIIPPVASAIRNGLGGAAEFVSGAFRNVGAVVRGAINTVIGLVNGAIGALNRLHVSIPAWVPGFGGQSFGINLPTIPKVATGADIAASHGGSLFIAGEGGRKETVTDFGKTNRLIEMANRLSQRALSGAAGSGGDFNLTQHITVDDRPRLWARAAGDELAELMSGARK